MRRDPAAAAAGVPIALLLDAHDSLCRAGREVRELGDPSGMTDESRIAQLAIEAVLRGTVRKNPAERSMPDREATLIRAARALEDLDDRLAAAGVLFS